MPLRHTNKAALAQRCLDEVKAPSFWLHKTTMPRRLTHKTRVPRGCPCQAVVPRCCPCEVGVPQRRPLQALMPQSRSYKIRVSLHPPSETPLYRQQEVMVPCHSPCENALPCWRTEEAVAPWRHPLLKARAHLYHPCEVVLPWHCVHKASTPHHYGALVLPARDS